MMNGAAHDTSDDLCLNISMNAPLQIYQKVEQAGGKEREKRPTDNPIRWF